MPGTFASPCAIWKRCMHKLNVLDVDSERHICKLRMDKKAADLSVGEWYVTGEHKNRFKDKRDSKVKRRKDLNNITNL